jgi:S-disulfanyl-L-cysteine oxidoreductase SoxD
MIHDSRFTIGLVLLCTCITAMASQPAVPRTVWDGVYTSQQALRGQAEYMKACASCHADDLRGKSTAPSLVEESFAFLWGDTSVGELLEKTQKLMPSDRPGSLPAETYRDIVAFILQSNKFPAGDQELASDPEALRKILITTKQP